MGDFSFHMPAFIFISGYFSKKTISFEKLIQKLVIPYLVYEMLYYLLYVFVIHKDTGLYLNRPKFFPVVSHGAVFLEACHTIH